LVNIKDPIFKQFSTSPQYISNCGKQECSIKAEINQDIYDNDFNVDSI